MFSVDCLQKSITRPASREARRAVKRGFCVGKAISPTCFKNNQQEVELALTANSAQTAIPSPYA